MNSKQIDIKLQEAESLLSGGKKELSSLILDELVANNDLSKEQVLRLGHIYMVSGQYLGAIESFSRAIVLDPENPLILSFLGAAYQRDRQHAEAELFITKALSIDENIFEANFDMASLLLASRRFPEARVYLEKCLKLRPGEPSVHSNLGYCYGEMGDYEVALKYLEKAIKLESGNPHTYEGLGRIYTELGDIEKATDYYIKAIKVDKTYGYAYEGLARVKKYSPEDKKVIEKIASSLKESMPSGSRASINYAMGKICNDCGEWDKAFKYYREANLLRKKSTSYTPPHKGFQVMKKIFTRKFLSSNNLIGSDSELPVFIVGMPRSGTSLVEQIIASHPKADGAGELNEMGPITQNLVFYEESPDIVRVLNSYLTKEHVEENARHYLDILTNGREDVKRVTDKMPDNFQYLGLIHMMFPNVKIIHTIRHPLDTCLSCYVQSFAELDWACDLGWIAKRYKYYREVMDYWYKVLPEGTIHDVHYEDMVEDTEAKSRELIDFIGLDWDDACLAFNKTARAVKTASLWQVRQPIYKTSKLRSRHYAKHLQGLAKDLSKYLQDDREMLAEWGLKLRPSWWPG